MRGKKEVLIGTFELTSGKIIDIVMPNKTPNICIQFARFILNKFEIEPEVGHQTGSDLRYLIVAKTEDPANRFTPEVKLAIDNGTGTDAAYGSRAADRFTVLGLTFVTYTDGLTHSVHYNEHTNNSVLLAGDNSEIVREAAIGIGMNLGFDLDLTLS